MKARPEQLTPTGNWRNWLLLTGRGWGKTRTGAQDIADYALSNPNVRCGVAGATYSDMRDICFDGESGIMNVIPKECIKGESYNVNRLLLTLYNGSQIQGFSADKYEGFRGFQYHRFWCDELAAWRYPEAFDQIKFGLRLGHNPQCIITTTPRPTNLIKKLVKLSVTFVQRGSTFENAENLANTFLEEIKDQYEGTRLGRQELHAEILDENEGALWNYKQLDDTRLKKVPCELQRIVVAIDPAVTSGEDSDETGIIVAGRGIDGRYYVIDDLSCRDLPANWMRKALSAYYKYNANIIVAETNNGGDLIESLLHTIDRDAKLVKVSASRGKMTRAEPISALYEQGRVSHINTLPKLEDQLCTYTGEKNDDADRLDALVWAMTNLHTSSGKAQVRMS